MGISNLLYKPKIRDAWYVIPTDKYVLFRGNRVFKVEGKSFREFLEVMLPLLRGDQTIREILNILSEYREEDIIDALNLLNGEGVLEDGSAKIPKSLSRGEVKRYKSNLEYFSLFSENKYEPQSNLKRARVAILGAGVLGTSIASSLVSSGVGRILLVGKKEVKNRDRGVLNGNGISSRNNQIKTKALDEINYESVSGLRGEYDMVVCAPDIYSPSLLNLVNRACIESSISWIPVYFLENEGFIGPLMASKEGCCYNCFQIRLLSNSEHIEEDKVFNEYLLKNDYGIKCAVPKFYGEAIGGLAVLEVINFLSKTKSPSTLGNVYIQNFKTLSGGLHRVMKVPNCSVCNSSKKGLSIRSIIQKEQSKWDGLCDEKGRADGGDVGSLIKRLENLVDERTGIIKNSLQSAGSKYLNLFSMCSWSATCYSLNRMQELKDLIFNVSWCKGKGETYEEAKCSALAEAVERYCCGMRDKKKIIRASYREVGKHAINPRDVVLFSENQYSGENFPWKRFSEDTSISWTPGFNLITKKPVLVPADFVYRGISEDRLAMELNNGAAAHTSRVEAILGGMFEIIERDGLMVMWFNRLPMPKIRVDSLPPDALRIVRKVNEFGFDVVVQDITTDVGIPSFCVFIVNRRDKKPALFSGAGCHLNPEIAFMKGLMETLMFFSHYLANRKKFEGAKTLRYDELRTPEHHAKLYLDPEMLRHLDFIIESEEYQDLGEIRDLSRKGSLDNLKYCLDVFGEKGMDVIAVDCTSPDVHDTGLCVMKVIIPGMQPIGFGMHNQRLGGNRLYNLPKELGYNMLPGREEDLNMVPHFFA